MATSNSTAIELSSHELLEAQGRLWNQTYNFINSMCLKCAIQLGIADVINEHGKPMPLSELTNALPINKEKSPYIPRVMRILVHAKLFVKIKLSEEDEEAYWLTPASRLLLRNEPFSQVKSSLGLLDSPYFDVWHHLAEWFQNDLTTMLPTAKIWETFGKEASLNQQFNEAMTNDSRLVGRVLVHEWKQVFDGLKTMVDVGGGQGCMARAIAEACPGLKITVLELPNVVDGLEGDEDVSFDAGDMFKSIPHADAVLLKWILHDWSDENCLKLLRNCKEAITSRDNGGKVIIIDMVLDGQEQEHEEAVETQLCCDISMMVLQNGKERTEKEWVKLFMDAGFTSYTITLRAFGLRSLMEVFP